MSADHLLDVADLVKALNLSERHIRSLARKAMNGPHKVRFPVLRDLKTKEPITDKDGFAYLVVDAPPARRGRPAISRGEHDWAFWRVQPRDIVTAVQRYLLPGSPLGTGHTTISVIAAAAGIAPGGPVRALGEARPGEPRPVIAADGPGTVLGMLLRPEGSAEGWRTEKNDSVTVLVQGKLLLPAVGLIGMGPGRDQLLWDPESLCWRGEPVEGRRLLELLGSWGLDHSSDGTELPAVFIDGDQGLRLDWMHHAEPSMAVDC